MERLVEGADGLVPDLLAVGDLVEVLLHVGREVVVHDGAEVLDEVVGDDDADLLGEELAALRAHGFGPGLLRDGAVLQVQVRHRHLHAVLVALGDIAAAGGEGADDGGVGGRTADFQFFQLLDEGGLGIALRGNGVLALGGDALLLHAVADVEFGEDQVALFGLLVVPAFQVHLHETVEQHLGSLDGVALAPAVGGDADGGVHHAGLAHLGGDGALPDQLVELLLLRGPFDGRVLDIGGTDGLVGFLRPLGLGPVLARVGIFLAEIVEDELLRRVQGQGGEVRRVGTHVGDQTPFIERLRDAHRGAHGEVELPGSLLLEGGRGERRGREPGSFLLFQGFDPVGSAHRVLEELPGVRHRLEAGVQQGLDLHAGRGPFRMEDGLHLIIGNAAEIHDLLLAVHDQAQGDALHAAGGELGLDHPPQDGGELEAHEPVQHAARLLRVHEVPVDVAGMLDRVEDGRFRDLVEDDPAGLRRVQAQRFGQVPGDGLSLAVLIGREPHGLGRGGEFLEVGHDLLLVGRNDIFGLEPMFHIHAQLLLLQVPDVADAGFHEIVSAQELLNGSHLSGRLDDH